MEISINKLLKAIQKKNQGFHCKNTTFEGLPVAAQTSLVVSFRTSAAAATCPEKKYNFFSDTENHIHRYEPV